MYRTAVRRVPHRVKPRAMPMDRPEQTYRFTFIHPLQATIVLDASGGTRCLARGMAWQQLEAQLKVLLIDRDEYWRLQSQELLSTS